MRTPVYLEPLDDGHVADLMRLAGDERVASMSHVAHPYEPHHAEAHLMAAKLGRKSGTRHDFAVLVENEFAGTVTLTIPSPRSGFLFYWIGADFWGRGIASEAVRLVTQYARSLRIQGLTAGLLVRNRASRRVLEKNGFRVAREFVNDGSYPAKFRGEAMLEMEWRGEGDTVS